MLYCEVIFSKFVLFKKAELCDRINELNSEMELAEELGDGGRVQEIRASIDGFKEELKILNKVTPHEVSKQ
jgi:hypothetical protein